MEKREIIKKIESKKGSVSRFLMTHEDYYFLDSFLPKNKKYFKNGRKHYKISCKLVKIDNVRLINMVLIFDVDFEECIVFSNHPFTGLQRIGSFNTKNIKAFEIYK